MGAVAVAGFAVKKIFDFGREGAVVEQTAESFDLLMRKVEAAPDLLDQLTSAAKGTISQMDLMSSTSTLLAGASGDVATALANATPQLLEIAKAANKLNPALGTTQFMYNSIATGVKRAQPLILDNLGLTIKVGAANEALAAKLGITVEMLTAEERTLAILNATLEAGDVMIEQVGGNTDSATDSFDQLTVEMKEMGNTIKKMLAPKLASAADAITLLLTSTQKLDNFLKLHAEELLDLGWSYAEFSHEMERAASVAESEMLPWGDEMLALYEALGGELPKTISWMEQYGNAIFFASSMTRGARENHFLLIDAYNLDADGARKVALETSEL